MLMDISIKVFYFVSQKSMFWLEEVFEKTADECVLLLVSSGICVAVHFAVWLASTLDLEETMLELADT